MTPEGRSGGLTSPGGDPRVDVRHSYEDFTQRPFYKEVNRRTIQMAPIGGFVALDIATGTGGIIEELVSDGTLRGPLASFVGIDIDSTAIETAEKKFENKPKNYRTSSFAFHEGSAEETGEGDNTFDLVTFCNAIHLTDVPASLKEVYRVLVDGGTLVGNSAFVKDIAYPGTSRRLWMRLVGNATRELREMDEIKNGTWVQEHPEDHFRYTREEYAQMMKDAGFSDVHTEVVETLMDIDDVKAICSYKEFAMGALPGIPYETARDLLLKAADAIFKELKQKGQPEVFPRNWLLFKAEKPLKAS